MTDQLSIEGFPKAQDPAPAKKKRVNSKKKGNGFEGHISKVLGEALAPMKFRRTQSSGAILGGKNSKFMENFSNEAKTLFVGDVVPTNEGDILRDEGWKFRFIVECKFYKNPPNLEHLFAGDQIRNWFAEAVVDAAKLQYYNKEPILIFKYNHTETYCAVWASAALPSKVTKWLTFNEVNPSTGNSGMCFHVFGLKEALLDLDWWKIK